jgi:hypothetical protein
MTKPFYPKIARHRGHSFDVLLLAKHNFARQEEGKRQRLRCVRCEVEVTALYYAGHWRDWTPIDTCGDIIARGVHNS